jgi:hypothetical protein
MATPVDQGDHDPTSNMTVVSSGNDADAAPENKSSLPARRCGRPAISSAGYKNLGSRRFLT